jgi:serine/threonine-protein kinase HipA
MPNQKYEAGSPRERLMGRCFALIDALGERELIQSPAVQRRNLLDQVIVNALLHNPDAHLKNYALLYHDDGTLEMTPLYDCLCTHGLQFAADATGAWAADTGPATHTRDLSLQIGDAIPIDRISQEDWEAFALECGFTQAYVRRRLKLIANEIDAQLAAVVDSVLAEIPAAERAAAAVLQGVRGQLNAVLNI